MSGQRAVVVGAGLAGLAATVELHDAGWEVHLVERGRLLGGKASSFTLDGVEVDCGQHVHLACCTAFVDFVRRLGMADRLHLQERFEVLVLRGDGAPARLGAGRLPAPLHLLPSFARYGALGPAAKAQVAWALLQTRRALHPGETFAAWLRRHHQGAQAIDAFWAPFVVPAVNAPLERVAAADALFVVSTAFLSDAGAARIGWSTVPLARLAEAAAARASQVSLRTPVVALSGGPARVQGVRTGDGATLAADAVVLAVPPPRLARILGEPRDYGVDGLEAFTFEPIVDVHLWYDAPGVGFSFAALLGSPLQWVFEKAPGYLCCSLSAASDVVRLPEAELIALCAAELGRALPALARQAPLRGAVTRDPDATFVPAPGLHRPGPQTTAPNLVIAGAWTDTGWPATMESAVRSGRAAAQQLLAAASREVRAVA